MADLNIEVGMKIEAASKALNIPKADIMKMINGVDRSAWIKKGIDLDVNQAADVVIKRLRKVYALNQEMPGDIDDLLTIPNAQVEFGEQGNQDDLQNFGGLDKDGRVKNQELALEEREKVKKKREANMFLRRKVVGKDNRGRKQYDLEEVYVPEGIPLPDEFRENAILRDFGLRIENPQIGPIAQLPRVQRGKDKFFRVGSQEVRRIKDLKREEVVKPFREEVAPAQQVMAEARRRVEAAGPSNIPGAYNIIDQLQDDIQGNRAAEASLVREMVSRNNKRFDPDLREVNDFLAAGQANAIAEARFGLRGGGAQADDALARIGTIGKIGHAKIAADFNVGSNAVNEGRLFNYDALPVDLAKRYEAHLSKLNAPIEGELSSRMQWLADNVPDNRDNGVLNDFPQVAINDQLNAVNEGLRNINFNGQGIDPALANVRGINGLQRAADAVIALGAQRGEGFFRLEDGKNIYVENPGINEVLQKMGFNDNRKGDLAAALYAIEMAQDKRKGNMLNDRRIFGGMQLNKGIPVARVGRGKIEGKEVAAQLQALDGRRADPPLNVQELGQARMPFIGGVQGEAIPRAGFLKGKAVNMSPEQRVEAFGSKNAAIANRLERERDIILQMSNGPVNPANPPAGSEDAFAAQLRSKDAQIGQLVELRNREANDREINEAFERMGMPLEGKGQMLLGGQIVNDPEPRPERNIVPSEVANNPKLQNKGNDRDVMGQPVPERFAKKIAAARAQFRDPQVSAQQATSAVVNPVSQVSPEISNNGVPPQPPSEAVAAAAPQQEKYQRMGYKFRPDGASRGDRMRREVIKRLERGRTQRRTGVAVGGAVAGMIGLDALIGNERDNREQEQYR